MLVQMQMPKSMYTGFRMLLSLFLLVSAGDAESNDVVRDPDPLEPVCLPIDVVLETDVGFESDADFIVYVDPLTITTVEPTLVKAIPSNMRRVVTGLKG